MEPTEQQKIKDFSRAKEIDTGATPLSMSDVLLDLPETTGNPHDISTVTTAPWDVKSLLSQKILLATIDVSPSTPENQPIWEFVNSYRSILSARFFAGELAQMFTSFSWTLCFKIEVRSNFQQVGLIALSYSNCPYILERYLSNYGQPTGFATILQLPHKLIPMGEDTDVEVKFAWNSSAKAAQNHHFTYNEDKSIDDYQMGTFRITVPYKMETAAGVNPNLTIRIWGYLEDVTLGGYQPRDSVFASQIGTQRARLNLPLKPLNLKNG